MPSGRQETAGVWYDYSTGGQDGTDPRLQPDNSVRFKGQLQQMEQILDTPMIFDTHCHYDDSAFDEDREKVLAAFREHGIGWATDNASDRQSIDKVLALSEQYPFLFCAAGIHPSELEGIDETWMEAVSAALDRDKTVALGEIGLDYHYDNGPDRETQKYWFRRQMEMALAKDMPVVIHSRDAAEDTLEAVSAYASRGLRGVIHCFSYSREIAEAYVGMGFFIGVGGVVTYKNGRKLKETVASIPMENIVIETDCPYLSPEPFRGRRNSSLNLPYVVKAVAGIRGISEEDTVRITCGNALRLYPKAAAYILR